MPIQIIPTSTNIERFNMSNKYKNKNEKQIKFVMIGGAQYPYLPKKALQFIKLLLKMELIVLSTLLIKDIINS